MAPVELKFIVDFMAGRLAKWLRMLGFDTLYFKEDNNARLCQKSLEEDRIILTRKQSLAHKDRVYLLKSELTFEQLKEVISKFKLKPKPLTRCGLCNTKLTEVNKEDVKGKVPLFVYQNQSSFVHCNRCNKYYWQGTHYDAIDKRIKGLFSNPPHSKNT